MARTTSAEPERPVLWAILPMNTAAARALIARSPVHAICGHPASGSQQVWARHQLGRALALHLVTHAVPGAWRIETTEKGKPIAIGSAERHISIAHTGSLVAAAVSSIGPIGIDIEFRDQTRDVVRLATEAFGRTEAAAVEASGIAAFYRIWTLREAISKATGEGLPLVVDRIDRVPADIADGVWFSSHANWLIAHDVLDGDVSLAMAVQSASSNATAKLRETTVASSRMELQ